MSNASPPGPAEHQPISGQLVPDQLSGTSGTDIARLLAQPPGPDRVAEAIALLQAERLRLADQFEKINAAIVALERVGSSKIPPIPKSRVVPAALRAATKPQAALSDQLAPQIRGWAMSHGITIQDRGPIPVKVRLAWESSHPGVPAS